MAKLTQNTMPGALTAPVLSTGQATAAPTPFAVVPPAQAKNKAPRKAAEAKVPTIRGEAWFQDNIKVGDPSIVVQVRRYPSRRNGFHCPGCGIAGSNGIVVRAAEGRGVPVILYEVDANRELVETETIMGWIVGETCLRKYGRIDIRKLGGAVAPPAA